MKEPTAPVSTELPDIQAGTLILCQLYEIGDEINLSLLSTCLVEPIVRQQTLVPMRRADSIQIAQLPVRVEWGDVSLTLAGISLTGVLRISIYDLGAVALAMELSLPQPTAWTSVAQLLETVQDLPDEIQARFLAILEDLEKVVQPAIAKPHRAAIVEDYNILVVEPPDSEMSVTAFAEHPLVWAALLGEQRSLRPSAAR
ncbi:MAG: hypothetical protein ACRDEA_02710, partial [Microcystaceae cyanobacterium]